MQVGPKSNDKCFCKMYRQKRISREGDVKTAAEGGVMWAPAKEAKEWQQ